MPDAAEEASDDEESLKKERKVDCDEKGAIKAKKDAESLPTRQQTRPVRKQRGRLRRKMWSRRQADGGDGCYGEPAAAATTASRRGSCWHSLLRRQAGGGGEGKKAKAKAAGGGTAAKVSE